MAKARQVLVSLYALVVTAVDAALIYGFFETGDNIVGLWWMETSAFAVALTAVTAFLSAAVLLWLGFKRDSGNVPPLLAASISFSGGLCSMLFFSLEILPYTILWVAVSATAFLGLSRSRLGTLRKIFLSYTPWIASDLLLILGSILCLAWLDESKVFIEAPLRSGSEIQVVIIALVFLASSLIRLGAFPFNIPAANLFARSESTWSAFFMGGVNYLLAGSRFMITAAFITGFIATDWSVALVLAGLLTAIAGPVQAIRAKALPSFIAGMYVFQAAFIIIGAGLFSRSGWEGAMFGLLAMPLFMVPGIIAFGKIYDIRGTHELGTGTVPAGYSASAFLVFLFSGLAMVGIPPSCGFIGKAVVVVSAVDKSFFRAVNSLAGVVVPIACAFAIVALVKTISQLFSARKEDNSKAFTGRFLLEGIIPAGLCGLAYLFGLFPDLLLGDVLQRASRALIPVGFNGPGIAFGGAGSAVSGALDYYLGWAADPAAFIAAVSAVVLLLYFINRASRPSVGPRSRFSPFEGGTVPERVFDFSEAEPRLRAKADRGKKERQ